MFGLGTQELVIIFAIVLILFGAKRLPEVGKGLGQAIRSFKKSTSEAENAITHDSSSDKATEDKQAGAGKKA